jgi:hypothetical protein
MRIRVGGAWRTITSGRIRTGGAWRTLSRAVHYDDGAWKAGVQFVPPLSVSISGAGFGSIVGSGTVVVGPVTATPTGGLGPYTYTWAQVSGFASFVTASANATTSFFTDLIAPSSQTATFRCTVTDALGNSAFSDTTVTFQAIDFS